MFGKDNSRNIFNEYVRLINIVDENVIERKLSKVLEVVDTTITDNYYSSTREGKTPGKRWFRKNFLLFSIIDFVAEYQEKVIKKIFINYPFNIY